MAYYINIAITPEATYNITLSNGPHQLLVGVTREYQTWDQLQDILKKTGKLDTFLVSLRLNSGLMELSTNQEEVIRAYQKIRVIAEKENFCVAGISREFSFRQQKKLIDTHLTLYALKERFKTYQAKPERERSPIEDLNLQVTES